MSSCATAAAGEEVKALSSKEIKKLAKPEFAANPEKFYPVKTLQEWGFSRAQCPKCGEHFWRHTDKAEVCGDSTCVGSYKFIGTGTGRGRRGERITYAQAWEGFRRSLTSARIPCTAIGRYPVVARWRTDVDYVAAGIYCFQPYCVTGELEPPANPLICPQFALRFNDLDNVGLSGRHFSGFVMLGIQVFNTPGKFVFFKEECVEFNLRWLTEELGIDLDEITLIEDVWCGGGNLGPSIEYFCGGLELGNMVFMQYKITDAVTGKYEPLTVQVIDVGIGMERIPWVINGAATSYLTTFPKALAWLSTKLGISYTNPIFERFGPYSCLLNMDETKDIEATWEDIAKRVGVSKTDLKAAIAPIQDMIVICDHTRAALMAIEDGSLPSSVGGAANLRNLIRRVFVTLHRNGWWDRVGRVPGLLELFQKHREELAEIYGPFSEYRSFPDIIAGEYARWETTDDKVKATVTSYVKKLKGKAVTVNDWVEISSSHGISADSISQVLGVPVPDNYYSVLAELNEQRVRPPPPQHYDTVLLSEKHPTRELFYEQETQELASFDAEVVAVLERVEDTEAKTVRTGEMSMLVLDRTCFYPCAGGQDNDLGTITIEGVSYKVLDVDKVGKIILHRLDKPVPASVTAGTKVHGEIDVERRTQLRNHHTATHVVYQSARRVLGPHVWQHGAKKTVEEAHLDITHFASLTEEQERQIENEANRAVRAGYHVSKTWVPKEQAEKKHGFKLYQGGVAAGKMLRVVDIEGFDTEACCGTHCDSTAQIGMIRIIRTHRLSDGVVRLHFVAGDKALLFTNQQSQLVTQLCDMWGVQPVELLPTADRIFRDYKKYSTLAKAQALDILRLQLRGFVTDQDPAHKFLLIDSDEPDPTVYHTVVTPLAEEVKRANKAVVVVGKTFFFALFASPTMFDVDSIDGVLEASRTFESRTAKRREASSKNDCANASSPSPVPAAAPAAGKWAPLKRLAQVRVPPATKGQKPKVVDGIVLLTGSVGAAQVVLKFFREKSFFEFGADV